MLPIGAKLQKHVSMTLVSYADASHAIWIILNERQNERLNSANIAELLLKTSGGESLSFFYCGE